MSLKAFLKNLYQGQTLVFGHRGASAYAPMNTLPAFELAIEQGADGIEFDVHRTKDGHVVAMHDFLVDRTTDGTGLITNMTLDEVKSLDAGSWFNAKFAGIRVPTLDEIIKMTGDNTLLNIEIKSMSFETDGVEQAVADCIARHQVKDRVLVSSFNPLTLVRFRDVMPDVALGYLYTPDLPTLPIDMLRRLTYEATHPHEEQVTDRFIERSEKEGYTLNTWTVNDPGRAVELRDMGVNGIITDKPDVILDALR